MIYVKAIKDMNDEAKTWIRIVGGDSKHFLVEMGLYREFVVSPFLFALMIDELTQSIQEEM